MSPRDAFVRFAAGSCIDLFFHEATVDRGLPVGGRDAFLLWQLLLQLGAFSPSFTTSVRLLVLGIARGTPLVRLPCVPLRVEWRWRVR